MFPEYTRCERVVDAWIHGAGIAFSAAVTAGFLVAAGIFLTPLDVAGLGIYCAGMIGMFVSSASYNMVRRHSLKAILRRVDHSAIFVMTAGTYTPFALLKIGGTAGYALLAAVWLIAAAGVYLKLRHLHRIERISIALYLIQGWLIVLVFDPLMASLSARALTLLIAGGCLYTIGVVFHLWERLKFHNAIWHAFVLCAAVCHAGAVWDAAFC